MKHRSRKVRIKSRSDERIPSSKYSRKIAEDQQMYGIQRALKAGHTPNGGPSQVHALGGSPVS